MSASFMENSNEPWLALVRTRLDLSPSRIRLSWASLAVICISIGPS